MKQNTLSATERLILRVIDLNADASVPEIVRITKLGAPLIHRVLKRLVERNILVGVTAQIDLARLGLAEYGISLALAAPSDRARENFLSQLSKEPSVGWVAEVGADLDCMFNVIAPTPHQVAALLGRLSGKERIAILRKELCIRTKRLRFERGIFGATGKRKAHFMLGLAPEAQSVDSLDRRILAAISISNRSSFRELARALSVSSSTFARRLEILRQKKIVLGFSWQMQLAGCGVLQYRLLVSLRDNSPTLRESVMKIVQNTPSIKMFADCIGAWDYEMELDVWDAREVKPVVAALSEVCFGHLESITIVPLFQHRKFSSFPIEP